MINERDERDGGFHDYYESFDSEIYNNEDNNRVIDERRFEQDHQIIDTRDEIEDFAFQNSHQNDESLDLINGIATISSNNPSIRSYQMSEHQRPELTENSNQGTIKMSVTEVTKDKTKK